MSEVGAFEAKTHLPQLLKRVQQGERFVITRHKRPVAELIPSRRRDVDRIRAAIDDLEEFQRTHTLGGAAGPGDDRARAALVMAFVLDCSVTMACVASIRASVWCAALARPVSPTTMSRAVDSPTA